MKHIFVLATNAMVTEKLPFSYFYGNQCQRNKFLHQNYPQFKIKTIPQSRLSLERSRTKQEWNSGKWNQVDKGHLRKIVLVAVSFAPLLMLPTLVARSRCIKLFVSWIFLQFTIMQLSEFYFLFNSFIGLIFVKLFLLVWLFCTQTPLAFQTELFKN